MHRSSGHAATSLDACWGRVMPTPRIPCPFTHPFTANQSLAAGFGPDALRGWIRRGEVVAIGRGTFAPANSPSLATDRLIHINRNITEGRHPVTYEGASHIHGIWRPPRLRPRHKVPQRVRDLPADHLEHHDGLLIPSRELTALELARWQSPAGALVALESRLHARPSPDSRARFDELVSTRAGWQGMRHVPTALAFAHGLSDSALEAYSLGLIAWKGLPLPQQQRRFFIDGYTYYADFCWPEHGLIGEADGALKYDAEGQAQFNERRRQARLQSLGFEVMRWGWPELLPNPAVWLATLARRLGH